MPDNDKDNLSPENIRVNKIIEETRKALSKLDEDIKNYRGALGLHYNPPGMVIRNETEKLKVGLNLENLKESLKEIALFQINEEINHLPLKEQDKIKERAHADLSSLEKSKILTEEKRKGEIALGENEKPEAKNIFFKARPSLTELFNQTFLYKESNRETERPKQQERTIDRNMNEKEAE